MLQSYFDLVLLVHVKHITMIKILQYFFTPQQGQKVLMNELNVLKDLGKNYHVAADDSGQTIVLNMNKKEGKSEDKDEVKEDDRIRMIKPQVSGDVLKVISPDKF